MASKIPLTRREFLRLAGALGGAAALSAFLQACRRAGLLTPTAAPQSSPSIAPSAPPPTNAPAPTAAPAETSAPSPTGRPTSTRLPAQPPGPGQVALVKTTDRIAGTRLAIDLLGYNPVAGQTVFLKPNFNSADPAPGSTHPDLLRALILKLGEMGAASITLGDRSGMGDTRAVMQALGVFDLASQLGAEVLVFDELGAQDWQAFDPPGSHWQQGFLLPKACLDCGAVVQTCCLKTHRFGGHFTLSLKNSVGLAAKYHPESGYNYMSELHGSAHQRRMIAEINAAYTPALIVMDGVEAFVSGGPDQGQKAAPGVILASADRVALDAVGVALLRKHGANLPGAVFAQDQIARAVELGLGVDAPHKIVFLTGDAPSAQAAEEIKELLAAE